MTAARTCVVLGANAFSGQDFIDLLLDDPSVRVIGVSRSPERPPWFLRYASRPERSRCRFVQMDLNTDMPELLRMLDAERPAHIAQFAVQSEVGPSFDYPEHWFQTNCVALSRLVNHLRRQTYVERYLYISSPEVYGTCAGTVREDAPCNPSTPYAVSRAAADMFLATMHRQFGFPLVTVRSTNYYGARQQLFKVIPRSVIYLKLRRPIELHGGGQAVKSYIHIRDVSRGELAVLDRGRIGEIYHLSPDQGMPVRDYVREVCALMGRDFEASTVSVGDRPGQDAAYVIDSSRARTELGWSPAVDLREGLEEVIRWIEENWEAVRRWPLEYIHQP